MIRPATPAAVILSMLLLSGCAADTGESVSNGDFNNKVSPSAPEIAGPEITTVQEDRADSDAKITFEKDTSSSVSRPEVPATADVQNPPEVQDFAIPDQVPARGVNQWGQAPSLVGAPLFAAQGIVLDLGLQVFWEGESVIDPNDPRCRVIWQMPEPGAYMQSPLLIVNLRCDD